MTFSKAIIGGFQNALNFSGRSRRPDYWWFFLFVFAGAFVIGGIEMLALSGGSQILTRAFQAIVFLPFLAVAWRRAQDTGRPGWWVLVPSGVVVASAFVSGSVSRQVVGQLVDGQPGFAAPMAGQSLLILALAVLQIAAGAVLIWWMSRPSQRGANRFGPEPRVRAK
jgi:uncharacterized membrane protein YhaH (DUF805 family)